MKIKGGTSIYQLYQEMISQKIISAYHGEFNQAVIEMLLKQAKTDMTRRNIDKKTFKKTYHILVECLENILKHTKKHQEMNRESIVMLSSLENGISITVGNLIDIEEMQHLSIKLDRINSLDRENLKEMHTEILTEGRISERGGAGLGLIEISIKSQNRIDYFFKDYNEKLVFFALETLIIS